MGKKGYTVLEKDVKKGKQFGVKFAFEMHPGDVVYNPETLLKLSKEVGSKEIAYNFDSYYDKW